VSFQELKRINQNYADRLDFQGDPAGALAEELQIRRALTPLATSEITETDIRTTLTGAGYRDDTIRTSTNAVRTAGTAFAVSIDGGCIFGAFFSHRLTVAIGGYVVDGGCLAENGH
jgi:hypothetical protein